MRTIEGADGSVSPDQQVDSASIHSNIWMMENGGIYFPHVFFHPVSNGSTLLFEIEYYQDGRINFGSAMSPEERMDIPENSNRFDRYVFPCARFELIDGGNYAFWEGTVSSLVNYTIIQKTATLWPIPAGEPFYYHEASFVLGIPTDSELIELSVRRTRPEGLDQLTLTDSHPHPKRVFEEPVDLTFPLEIGEKNMAWLIGNRRNLNQAEVQKEAIRKLQVGFALPSTLK